MTRNRTKVLASHVAIGATLVVLLAASARTPASPAAAGPKLDIQHCADALQSSGSDSVWIAIPPARFVQPIGTTENVNGVQIDLTTSQYASATLRVVYWDPVALVPDPSTVALRSVGFPISYLSCCGNPRATFSDPPLVLRTVSGLAETPRSTTALDYRMDPNPYGAPEEDLYWSPNGAPGTPHGYSYSGATPVPLPGPNGVLSHAICGGTVTVRDLQVCQSVMSADSLFGDRYAVAQKFRVPVATRLDWVELAFGLPAGSYNNYGTIAVLDAESMSSPPTYSSAALAHADFAYPAADAWGSHYPFDQSVILQPDHDYWLWATTNRYFTTWARKYTGTEGPAFTGAIGTFWSQPTQGSLWFNHPRYALDFKILGEPVGVTGIGDPARRRSGALQLTAGPNPTRAATALRWSGAKGGLLLEIYDPSGRRIAAESREESEGHWMWRGTRADGRASVTGVYFVRAVDAAGQSATLRVAVVR